MDRRSEIGKAYRNRYCTLAGLLGVMWYLVGAVFTASVYGTAIVLTVSAGLYSVIGVILFWGQLIDAADPYDPVVVPLGRAFIESLAWLPLLVVVGFTRTRRLS